MEVLSLKQIKNVEAGEGYAFQGVVSQLKDRTEGNQEGTAAQAMLIDDGFAGKRISVAWKPPSVKDLKLLYVGENCVFTGVTVKALPNPNKPGDTYNALDATEILLYDDFVAKHGEPEDYTDSGEPPKKPSTPVTPSQSTTRKGSMTNEEQKEAVDKLRKLIVHLYKETTVSLPTAGEETCRALAISVFIAATGRDRLLCPDFSAQDAPSQKPEDESQDVQSKPEGVGPFNSPEDVERKKELQEKHPETKKPCSECDVPTKLKDMTISTTGDLCEKCDDIPF